MSHRTRVRRCCVLFWGVGGGRNASEAGEETGWLKEVDLRRGNNGQWRQQIPRIWSGGSQTWLKWHISTLNVRCGCGLLQIYLCSTEETVSRLFPVLEQMLEFYPKGKYSTFTFMLANPKLKFSSRSVAYRSSVQNVAMPQSNVSFLQRNFIESWCTKYLLMWKFSSPPGKPPPATLLGHLFLHELVDSTLMTWRENEWWIRFNPKWDHPHTMTGCSYYLN